jgi:hypothetical protein
MIRVCLTFHVSINIYHVENLPIRRPWIIGPICITLCTNICTLSLFSPTEDSVSKASCAIKVKDKVVPVNEYNNPSFATMFERALLNTYITTCFGLSS